MAKKRANGEGMIRKRKDGLWEYRYTAGYDENGKIILKSVYAKTQRSYKSIRRSWLLSEKPRRKALQV